MIDHPFDKVVRSADKIIRFGAIVYQKFTCSHCGKRQTIDVPNTFYTSGSCEECYHITNIKEKGCNYLVVYGFKQPSLAEMQSEQARSAAEVQERSNAKKRN